MTINLHWGLPGELTFKDILDSYSNTSVNSNHTSSIPFAQFWSNTEDVINSLKDALELKGSGFDICFEYPTPSCGRAKPSMSDAMLISDCERVAVEGKFTEVNEKYEPIADWYNRVTTGNKVLPHWVKMLEKYIENPEHITKDSAIPYQFLHRTASACYGEPEIAICLYQIFVSNETKANYKSFVEKLENSIQALNPKETLKFFIQEIQITHCEPYRKSNDDNDFFEPLKNGRNKPFTFGDIIVRKYDKALGKFN